MVIMTDFEKLVVETPITMDCFEMDDYVDVRINEEDNCIGWTNQMWHDLIYHLELLRETYNETKDERYLKELMRLLPNSYRVRKDNVQYEFREVKCHKMI